jgi:hypothetical protein
MALFEQTPFLNGGLFECLDREASDEEKQQYDKDKAIRPVKSAIRIDGFSDNPKNELQLSNDYSSNSNKSLLIKPFSFKNHTNKIRVKRRIKLLWVWFSWFLSLGNLTCVTTPKAV